MKSLLYKLTITIDKNHMYMYDHHQLLLLLLKLMKANYCWPFLPPHDHLLPKEIDVILDVYVDQGCYNSAIQLYWTLYM